MSKTRREFLAEAAVGLAAAAASAAGVAPAEAQDPSQQQTRGRANPHSVPAPALARKFPSTLSPKPKSWFKSNSPSRNSKWPPQAGAEILPPSTSAALARINWICLPPSSVLQLESRPPRTQSRPRPRPIRSHQNRSRPAPPKMKTKLPSLLLPPPLPLGRDAPDHFRAPHANLFEASRAVQSETPLRHHAHQRFGHRASQAGRH